MVRISDRLTFWGGFNGLAVQVLLLLVSGSLELKKKQWNNTSNCLVGLQAMRETQLLAKDMYALESTTLKKTWLVPVR